MIKRTFAYLQNGE